MKLNIIFETLFAATPGIVLALLWSSLKSRLILIPISLILVPMAIYLGFGMILLWKQDYFAVLVNGKSLRFNHTQLLSDGDYEIEILDYKAEGIRQMEIYKRQTIIPGIIKGKYLGTLYPRGLINIEGISNHQLTIDGPLEGQPTQRTSFKLGS